MARAHDPTIEVVVLHLSGAVSTRDCLALFESLLIRARKTDELRVLFDWCSLGEWTLEDWAALGTGRWVALARPLARVALVHHVSWKRQAAMLAAILRRQNVRVRSWKPEQIDTARAWLAGYMESNAASDDLVGIE